MQIIADFFTNSLIVPVYFYFVAYSFVWVIAYVVARLFMNRSGIERATTIAWSFALGAHLIGGVLLTASIWFRAIPRLAEWWHVPIYLALYVLFLIVDLCLLVSVLTGGRNRRPNPSGS